MTALTEFSRLESGGLWRATPEDQRREVIVSLGNATLIITDMANRPLTHWSLPAVARLNGTARPALFSPDADTSETLEISDDLMIDAIEKVRRTVTRRRSRPGRLRGGLVLGTAAVLAAAALLWLPDAMIRQAQTVVPPVKRSEIGATLLGHIQRITGRTCRSRLGSDALAKLHQRTLGTDAGGQAFVVPAGPEAALYLPGGLIVLNRDLIEDTEDPAVVAGHLIAARAQAYEEDPLAALLRDSGFGTTFTLLTTGEIGSETLRAYAERLLADPPPAPADETMIDLFDAARLPSSPYAYALDVTGEATLGLIESDPMQGQEVPPLLSDAEWISLQGICS
ncbi:hypothetical protein [Thalassorhabdomicrobium marinisediminis]|uniref:hypothetical protein n=1 Tax=Thalassorhabdomicrobium marinisediminis TaxID=2170577 RepID=UPI00248FDB98|nr:hypothetical protein [Thalassorhabdomicrobium marinisediminis]